MVSWKFFLCLFHWKKINLFFSNNKNYMTGFHNCDAGVAIAVHTNTSGHCNCGADPTV